MHFIIALTAGLGLAIGLQGWGWPAALIGAAIMAAVFLWTTRNTIAPGERKAAGLIPLIYAALFAGALALEGIGYGAALIFRSISN